MASQLTYEEIRKRTAYLRGETSYDTSSTNTIINDHINAAVREILKRYPFSWNLKKGSSDLTLSSGTANLSADFNPKWGLKDARIVNSNQNDDSVFTQIPVEDRDLYDSGDYVYWLTYDTTNKVHVFNSLTQSGSVEHYYNFFHDDMSADEDVCIIPDGEAVAYLAASKMWVGDERNVGLSQLYEQEANARVQALIEADAMFGPVHRQGSVVGHNFRLRRS